MRLVMYPYTAINLQESSSNSIKDFLSLKDVYGLSHMMIFTNTEKNSYLRLAKMSQGPTITFKIKNYILSSEIFSNTEKYKKPLTKNFDHIPLIIMNGFNNKNIPEEYDLALKTTSIMFQSFFPPLNLNEIQIKKCKRVVLLSLNIEEGEEPQLLFRHYDIEIGKFSVNKSISNFINNIGNKKDLSQYDNIADYVLKQSGFSSGESDIELGKMGEIDTINDKNFKEEKMKIKLKEIGPRLNLTLHKIEEGFLKGNVIFHRLIHKSKKEIREIMLKKKEKLKEKKKRIEEQNKNIKNKENKKIELKEEKNEEIENKEENEEKNKFLNKKTKREDLNKNKFKNKKNKKNKNKLINPQKETIMTKRSLKQFNNLKKYK